METEFDLSTMTPQLEDAFGFSIPPEDIAGLTGCDKLREYVLDHRFRGSKDACLNSIALYKVRRALMAVLKAPRDALQPSTRLATILPRHRRRIWQAIERTAGCRLPWLRRPPWVVTLASIAAFALGIAVPATLGIKPFRGGVLVGLISIAAFGFALAWLTERLAHDFPPGVTTVGELARAVLARNYRPILAELNPSMSEADVEEILQRIVGGREVVGAGASSQPG
ncbi:MAG: hypothetical protein ABFC96_18220 [Thermoguttaceae bacterium]